MRQGSEGRMPGSCSARVPDTRYPTLEISSIVFNHFWGYIVITAFPRIRIRSVKSWFRQFRRDYTRYFRSIASRSLLGDRVNSGAYIKGLTCFGQECQEGLLRWARKAPAGGIVWTKSQEKEQLVLYHGEESHTNRR